VLEEGIAHQATLTGSTPLTLQWASPEQLRSEPVGVASDIYQLGLLLYWLLTGAWPFEEDEGALPLLRAKRESTPSRPSERAAERGRARQLRGDLDAIVLRCLASRPEERYRTARELQQDLRNYLQAQPVNARRHTARYLARAFVRRNRWAVLLGATLLAYAVTLSWQALALVEQRESAEQARARAESTHGFLLGVLGSADPEDHANRGRDLDEMLRAGAQRAARDFAGQPLVAAQLLADLGIIMQRRSRFEDAQEALRAAIESRTATLGPVHADTLAVRFRWAAVLQDLARHGESRAELAVLQPAVEAQFGAGSLELAEVLTQSSYASSLAGEHDSAEAMLVRARAIVDALAEDHPPSALTRESRAELRANIVVGLGNVLLRAKRREEAEPIVNEAYALHRAMWGDDDPRTLETRQNRAFLWRQLRRFPESRAEFEAALAAQRRLYGGPHQLIAYTIAHIANLHSDVGDYDGAVRVWRESEAEARAAMGDDHPWIATSQFSQARSLMLGGHREEARGMLERLVALPGREDGLPQRAATLLAELNAKGAEP
jgi:tetratricopeptide (TPR) repeat protein